MKISELYNALIRYITQKSNFIDVLFYLIAGCAFWYFYNFKVLIALILLLLSTAALSSFLIEAYFWAKRHFKSKDKDLIYSFLFVIVMLPLVLLLLDKLIIGYILALSFVIAGLGVFRS